VTLKLNCAVGEDISFTNLRAQHDAVLIATGVYKSRELGGPGVGLPGIVRAIDYLTASNRKGFGDAVPEFDSGELDAEGKRVVVVGGGDTAMEEANYLTKFASEVVIVHRRDSFRASQVMAQRALENPKIRVLWNTAVVDVLGGEFVTGVRLKSLTTGVEEDFECGGLFVAIGHTPNTSFLEGALDLTEHGYVQTPHAWRTRTSVNGVFAAGDVMDDYFRQAITAAGTGCMAALEAERWLALHEGIGQDPVLETAESSIAQADHGGIVADAAD
jgi:thioredoxin reductase